MSLVCSYLNSHFSDGAFQPRPNIICPFIHPSNLIFFSQSHPGCVPLTVFLWYILTFFLCGLDPMFYLTSSASHTFSVFLSFSPFHTDKFFFTFSSCRYGRTCQKNKSQQHVINQAFIEWLEGSCFNETCMSAWVEFDKWHLKNSESMSIKVLWSNDRTNITSGELQKLFITWLLTLTTVEHGDGSIMLYGRHLSNRDREMDKNWRKDDAVKNREVLEEDQLQSAWEMTLGHWSTF